MTTPAVSQLLTPALIGRDVLIVHALNGPASDFSANDFPSLALTVLPASLTARLPGLPAAIAALSDGERATLTLKGEGITVVPVHANTVADWIEQDAPAPDGVEGILVLLRTMGLDSRDAVTEVTEAGRVLVGPWDDALHVALTHLLYQLAVRPFLEQIAIDSDGDIEIKVAGKYGDWHGCDLSGALREATPA